MLVYAVHPKDLQVEDIIPSRWRIMWGAQLHIGAGDIDNE